MRDPYEVLEISRHAPAAEVKAAFRRQAARHHPDKNPTDPQAQARFQELNAAYQLLSDPAKRAAYDRYGARAFQPGGHAQAGFAGAATLQGVLDDLLGALGIRTGAQGDMRQRLVVDFVEAARGATRSFEYRRVDACATCSGTGGQPDSGLLTCPGCGGRGRTAVSTGAFSWPVERTCPRCRGSGQILRGVCQDCHGTGLRETDHTVVIEVAPGVKSGSTRLVPRGGSRARPDGPPGDLEIVIEVRPHPIFTRDGDDVRCDVPVDMVLATLGGEVLVPTLDGEARLRIPAGTQTGAVLRLRGKGLVHQLRAGSGDQLVKVAVRVPTKLSARARGLLEELAQELGQDVGSPLPADPTPGLFSRLRQIFD